jgi:hypothetical protein
LGIDREYREREDAQQGGERNLVIVTIAVVRNFTEGVIFAVDSAVSAVNEATGAVLHVFENGQKIYHIGKDRDCLDSPYGAMLFGSASFSRTSWRNVFADFCNRYNPAAQDSAQDVVAQFVEYLRNLEPSEEKRPSGGVFLAGYGPSDSAVRCFKIDEHDLSSKEIPIGALSFDGIADIVQKHLFGIALRTKRALEKVFGDVMINTQEEGGEQKQIPGARHRCGFSCCFSLRGGAVFTAGFPELFEAVGEDAAP